MNEEKKIKLQNLNKALHEAYHEQRGFSMLPKGDTFRDLSTIIITATRGDQTEVKNINCPKCSHPIEYESFRSSGFHPIVVESWKRLIRPMNQPIIDMIASGYEVGDAYEQCVQAILKDPQLSKFKYILFLEDDIIIPYMQGTKGPLWKLYDYMGKFDVAAGLYWTKGEVTMPLIFGDPAQGTDNFECLTNWNEGEIVECNGTGMGFALIKINLFRDTRIERPWFKTMEEVGAGMMTQDLFFYKKIRKLGYRICVDTGIKCGHLDARSGQIY